MSIMNTKEEFAAVNLFNAGVEARKKMLSQYEKAAQPYLQEIRVKIVDLLKNDDRNTRIQIVVKPEDSGVVAYIMDALKQHAYEVEPSQDGIFISNPVALIAGPKRATEK